MKNFNFLKNQNYIYLNSLLFTCINLLSIPFSEESFTSAQLFYLVFAIFGYYLLLNSALCFIASMAAAVSRERVGEVVKIILLSSFNIILLLDLKIYYLYHTHIDSMVLNFIFGGAASYIFPHSASIVLYAIAAIFLITAFQIVASYLSKKIPLGPVKWITLFSITVIASTNLTYSYASFRQNTNITSLSQYIPWPLEIRANKLLKKMGLTPGETRAKDLHAVNANFHYPRKALDCRKREKPLNVLMLLVDTTRYDVFNSELMPNVTEFSKQSTVFKNHYSTGNTTRFGLFGLMYGLPANYWFKAFDTHQGSIFIHQLKEQNYQFFIYGSAPLSSPEFDKTAFVEVKDKISPVRGDDEITGELIKSLTSVDRSRPFFGFYFLDAPHHPEVPEGWKRSYFPYTTPVNYFTLTNNTDRLPYFNQYKESIRYTDSLFGEVIRVLKEQQLLENTIVLITSDHGEEFNESNNNHWGHNNSFSDYQARVPFILYWPGRKPSVIEAFSSHADWTPTLMQEALLCQNQASDYSSGLNLFQLHQKGHQFLSIGNWNNGAVITRDGLRYVYSKKSAGIHVYDRYYRRLEQEPKVPEDVVNFVMRNNTLLNDGP